MAHLGRNCHQAVEAPGQCCSAYSARQARFYRLQIGLASVIGVLTLAWVLSASPRQEVLLKSVHAQTLTVFDELVAGEVCEMSNGKSAGKTCCYGKIFKAGCGADRKLNSAKDVITCLIRKGTTKLQAALS